MNRLGLSIHHKRSILLEGQNIEYVLRISKRRTIGLKIDAEGLVVTCPVWVGESELERALHQQSDWIFNKLKSWADRKPEPSLLLFEEGQLVWWLGQQIPIRFVSLQESLPRPLLPSEFHHLEALPLWNDCSDRLAAVSAWYANHALPWFRSRIPYFAEQLGRSPRAIKISHAKGRWGSCNRNGVIRLNWRLMQASPAEIDYVIAHECAHLVHMNHSAEFWKTVGTIHPNWKPISKLLDSRDRYYRSF